MSFTPEEKHTYSTALISDLCYSTSYFVGHIEMILPKMKPSGLKDVIYGYEQMCKNYLGKMMKALKDYSIKNNSTLYESMRQDLEGLPILDLFAALDALKKSKDISVVAEIIEACVDVEDMGAIKTNILALVRNQKSKENVEQKV